ncbi:unnamed protein product [Ceutorhynchus assimilis]|uniref:Apoptosis-stimulating of p53 protein 2-like RA domain-containing protein n=1 Tax=Ceutorhynchus assimilis TaxID=467358 RepID=A0A9N9MIF7_9CUCU|nr:unnamed protein product [Ceutorhynchus assimilis]
MWLSDTSRLSRLQEDSDLESSCSSGEEIPIWVRGEQRWVSGITEETRCIDVIDVLCKDEEKRGKHMGLPQHYQITERWRGVEQSLEPYAKILDIWNTWGSAQTEVKISLRRLRSSTNRRTKCRSDVSTHSDRSMWKTVHPKRFQTLNTEKGPSSTEELLKLVLAQGEVIRRQLKKLRHSDHQIGYLEDKTHRARVRKHGSNYLLETYLKGLSEAVNPDLESHIGGDKNSDSGVMTEGDSEQSNNHTNLKDCNKNIEVTSDRFSASSEEFNRNIKDDDTSSTLSDSTIKNQTEFLEKIIKLNKNLLKEEETINKLDSNLRKYDKHKQLTKLRTDMTKSACEMQHNEVVLEETLEVLEKRRKDLENLHRELTSEDQEYEMLQALLYSNNNIYRSTKETLDTLV